MKGIVFNLLEETVRSADGERAWDELLDLAGVDGAYTALGSYPDAEFQALVVAASARRGVEVGDYVRSFGRTAMPLLAQKYPRFFAVGGGTRAMLLALNDIIHPEVRKLYPGALVPRFRFEPGEGGVLCMDYDSERRLCAFAEGLISGAADVFGEQVVIAQRRCTLRGDASCRFELSFSGGPARG
jgi:hypothetical protein